VKHNTDDTIVAVIGTILMLLFVSIVVAACIKDTRKDAAEELCISAGYDGWLKADGADWCYRIVGGTRVLTPYSVVPKSKDERR